MLLISIILTLTIVINILQFAVIYVYDRQVKILQSIIRKNRKGEDLDFDEGYELLGTVGPDETINCKIITNK